MNHIPPRPACGERVGVRGQLNFYSASTRNRARQLRKSYTAAEVQLWRVLRNRNLTGIKFRRQHPRDRYVVDFVSLEHRLVIEVDGSQHAQQVRYDTNRTAILESLGFRVIRFWDNDVLNKFGQRIAGDI